MYIALAMQRLLIGGYLSNANMGSRVGFASITGKNPEFSRSVHMVVVGADHKINGSGNHT